MAKILVVGSILIERQYFTDIIPQANQIGYVKDHTTTVGSKVINAGRVLAAKHEVDILGSVGQDQDANLALERLNNYKINDRHVSSNKGTQTGQVIVTTNQTGASAITLMLGASSDIRIPSTQILKKYDSIYVESSFNLKSLYQLIKRAHLAGTPMLLDLPNQQSQVNKSKLKHVQFLIPNRQEAEALLGRKIPTVSDALSAVSTINSFTSGTSIITLDNDGCVIFLDKPLHIPAKPTQAQDVTACGDIFRATFLHHYLNSPNLYKAAEKATAGGGTCGRPSPDARAGATATDRRRKTGPAP